MKRPSLLAAGLLACFAQAGLAAPSQRSEPVPLPPVAPREPETAVPPYQARLDRLAELMGTLAFLRNLCGNGDGAAWRTRMQDLLAAEGVTDARRDRLAGSFNRGYTSYQLTYRRCTASAQTAMARSLKEGAKIAADVSARFGTQ